MTGPRLRLTPQTRFVLAAGLAAAALSAAGRAPAAAQAVAADVTPVSSSTWT